MLCATVYQQCCDRFSNLTTDHLPLVRWEKMWPRNHLAKNRSVAVGSACGLWLVFGVKFIVTAGPRDASAVEAVMSIMSRDARTGLSSMDSSAAQKHSGVLAIDEMETLARI